MHVSAGQTGRHLAEGARFFLLGHKEPLPAPGEQGQQGGGRTDEGCFFLPYSSLKSESVVFQSCPTLCNPMDCSHQAPLSMEFCRQEFWSGLIPEKKGFIGIQLIIPTTNPPQQDRVISVSRHCTVHKAVTIPIGEAGQVLFSLRI